MIESNRKRIKEEKLRAIVNKILECSGLSDSDAQIVSDCMIESDLCGVHTHGVSILKSHVKRIIDNGYNLKPIYKEITKTSSFEVLDVDNSIGFLSSVYAMNKAIQGATESGIYTVFTRNANTYGPAFYYPYLASQKGFVGITFCNSPSAMAPWGGIEKLLGTNPLALAIPCNLENTIIFDMATSKVAKSKINQARINNESIPNDWALDKNGNPTVNPSEAIEGLVLPMAEHKGYGLALSIDIIAGVLSGAGYLNNIERFYSKDNKCMNVGQVFIAIDPVRIQGDDFYDSMDSYVRTIHESKSQNDNPVRLPGDGKYNYKKNSKMNGIVLDAATINSINDCLEMLNQEERI